MTDIAVVTIVKNEEKHLPRFFAKLAPLEPKEVFLVDSLSTDRTKEMAEAQGAKVIPHAWPGFYATQYNWAIDNCPVTANWVLRLDADEYLSEETALALKERLATLPENVTALELELRRVFMGGVIHYGTAGIKNVRVWRTGCCRIEDREMDEHMVVLRGETMDFGGVFYDDTLQSFKEWQEKHYTYARKEAANFFKVFCDIRNIPNPSPTDVKKIQYYTWPCYVRGLVYFGIRYFAKLGFLDGVTGWRWHFWQGYWYRWIVDNNICETKKVGAFKVFCLKALSVACLVASHIVLSPLILLGMLLPKRD